MNTPSTPTAAVSVLSYRDVRAYGFALIFTAGNIVLPQLCHLIPQGGLIFLPIYFFTLIAAYRYGIVTGLVTALASPTVNSLLFGMPPTAALPIILIKSTLLALAASWCARRACGVRLGAVAAAVVIYQAIGALVEAIITQSATAALQDLTLGWPGIVLQIVGGYLLLRAWKN